VDMDNFPGYTDDFLGELFPGLGAINTQAWYLETNQANARARMKAGDSPEEIIQWLYDNDAQNQPERRQYGIVAFVDGSAEGAAFTGTQTDDWKGHIVGPNYSIQGNILLGQEILDSMEAQFLRADGDLACKLMAALQGANVVGADTRCASNGSSSLFAFVKVAQSTDTFGFPSFVVSMRSKNGEGIEPIDSLQTLFDLVHDCNTVGLMDKDIHSGIRVYPNPMHDHIIIEIPFDEPAEFALYNSQGILIMNQKEMSSGKNILQISNGLPDGIYFYRLKAGNELFGGKLVK
jgi:uncharacterized Ntn-hydrolase superfamily protein